MSNSNDDRLANLVAVAATGLTDAMHQAMTTVSGLDGAASTALVALLDFAPGGSIHQLSAVLGLTHSGAVRLVDRLVAADLAVRTPGKDARSRTIRLTRSGAALARKVRRARADAARETCAVLTTAERATLAVLSERLVAQLSRTRLAQRQIGETPQGGALCRLCDFGACGRSQDRCPAQRAVAEAWVESPN